MHISKLLMIMKLTVFLFFACLLNLSAKTVAQNVSLEAKQVPFKDILREIQKQTGMNVMAKESLINEVGAVSVSVQNMPVSQLLELCLKNKTTSFSITGNNIVFVEKKQKEDAYKPKPLIQVAVSINVTGTVLDENGKAVLATITVKGTRYSVPTDDNGNFILNNIDENSTLIVTGVNIETREIKVNGKLKLIINVKREVEKLESITVTGYGIERRTKELGYSVAKVKSEDINRANTGNLLTGIVGKISGVNITTQSTDLNPQQRILIRGIRSFGENSNNQPLFIFNGAPLSFGNDNNAASQVLDFINSINPSDIEDVTVLKGANGTAIYGPEGVNGVIIITTKKGLKGKPVINFRNNTSFQIVDFRRDFKQRKFGIGNGTVDANGNGVYDPQAQGNWGPAYDGSLVPIGFPDENGVKQQLTYSDKKDFRRFFDMGIANRVNLSFANADVLSSSYLGIGLTVQTGILPGDKQNQFNILYNSSRKFGKLNVQFNINYARTNSDRGPAISGQIRSTPTFVPLLSYKNYQTDYWSNKNRYWNYISPYETLASDRTKTITNGVLSTLIFELKPLSWLTIKDQPGINYNISEDKRSVAPQQFAAFAARQDISKAFGRLGQVSEEANSANSLNNDFQISTVNKAGNFLIRSNFGNTIRQSFTKILRARSDLFLPIYNLAFSATPVGAAEQSFLSRTISLFGNTSIGYKDKIFFEVTARNEWDSKRAKIARGKDFYASANTSVILKQVIKSLQTVKWLTTLNIRASVARSANLNISPYQADRILQLSQGYPFYNQTDNTNLLSYGFGRNIPNPLIKPEIVNSQEYGVTAAFLNNRITLDATFYHQVNNAVILNGTSAWLSGYPTTDNAGRFKNYGVELDLKLNPLIKLPKDFNLSLELRGSFNNNKVLSLLPVYNGQFPLYDEATGQALYARTGNSAYEFAVTDWKRNADGKIIVDKNTGFPLLSAFGEFVFKGNTLPKYNASAGINFSWKRISFNMLFDYVGGFTHLFPTRQAFYTGIDVRTTFNDRQPYIFPDAVYDDGTGKFIDNDIPVVNAGLDLYQNHAQVSSLGLVSASSFKMREIALQYTLPTKKGLIKELVISIYGRDLLFAYPSANIFGDPALVKGPGVRDFQTVQSNTSGSSSEETGVPGSILFGGTLSLKF